MTWLTLSISLILVTITGLYFLIKRSLSYWKRRGVYYIEPEFLWGNSKALFKGEMSLGNMSAKFYQEFKSNGVIGGGIYMFSKPSFFPVDLELVRNIIHKDFNHFVNHGMYFNEEDDPLSAHLFNIEDEKWKYLRAKLTPTFTSGKLKMMFETITACSNGLVDVLQIHGQAKDPVNIKDVVSRYSTDIIGSCAFGIECNTLKNPKSEFRKYGKKMFYLNFFDKIRRALPMIFSRELLKKLHFKETNRDVERFFMNIVHQTVDYRERNNIHRKDFMHLLLELKNQGQLSDHESLEEKQAKINKNVNEKLTMNELAAQCFVFYIAGFETTATTITFALLEMAMNQEIQDKLRTEISAVLKKNDGKITYEAIMEMTYLNMVVYETLRKHPPFPALPRICNKSYKIPDTDITLEKGTVVHISVLGIHRDPEYYPEPEKFDPERFNEENKAKRHPYSFLAFGEGTRVCIGSRFGLLETKVGILAIIKNFKVTLNNKTKTPIKYSTKNMITDVDGEVWLDVAEIH